MSEHLSCIRTPQLYQLTHRRSSLFLKINHHSLIHSSILPIKPTVGQEHRSCTCNAHIDSKHRAGSSVGTFPLHNLVNAQGLPSLYFWGGKVVVLFNTLLWLVFTASTWFSKSAVLNSLQWKMSILHRALCTKKTQTKHSRCFRYTKLANTRHLTAANLTIPAGKFLTSKLDMPSWHGQANLETALDQMLNKTNLKESQLCFLNRFLSKQQPNPEQTKG